MPISRRFRRFRRTRAACPANSDTRMRTTRRGRGTVIGVPGAYRARNARARGEDDHERHRALRRRSRNRQRPTAPGTGAEGTRTGSALALADRGARQRRGLDAVAARTRRSPHDTGAGRQSACAPGEERRSPARRPTRFPPGELKDRSEASSRVCAVCDRVCARAAIAPPTAAKRIQQRRGAPRLEDRSIV